MDPAAHYLRRGMAEGRWPSAAFDVVRYEAMNPQARGNALVHFHRLLAREGCADLQPADVVAVSHAELDSGLFDIEWYLARIPQAGAEAHPFVHYASNARRELLPPGPLFDSAAYVREQPDSLKAVTPLTHFLAVRDQGVTAPVLAEPTRRGPLMQPRIGPIAPRGVCVMIHAFYADVLPELLRAIEPLAGSATLLVSVCSATEVTTTNQAIDDILGTATPRVVKVVANRGRNFAPLLVHFGEELRQHHLVLHLHTKKSLHAGAERLDWRGHLLRCLTGPAIAAHLDLFRTQPEVGVIQPSIFPLMPPWSAHWLGNVDNGRKVFQRCGLDRSLVGGYVDYPVGGMFWARVNALTPLLDAGFRVEDFEVECGQTDRTLAHAIERTIVSAAAAAGYCFVEYDPAAAQWRANWSSRNTDSFGSYDIDTLRRQIDIADLVSVDLFDTLVLRPTLAPNSLPYFAARAVLDDPAEAESWLKERVQGEHRSRLNRPQFKEVTLAEVFSELPPAMQGLQAEEIAIESRVALPRRWLIEELRWAKEHGKRLVAMTDSTLDPQCIKELVAKVGAGGLFDEWYISNERRVRKDQGDMWEVVRQSEAVPVSKWLHLGADETADLQQSLDHAIHWSHIPAPGAVAQFFAPDVHLEHESWATQAALGLSATRLYDARNDPRSEAVFGYSVLGPLVATFGSTLVRHRLDHPDEAVLLMAGDTSVLQRAVEQWHRARPASLPSLGCLLTSRRAALAVSAAAGLDIDLLVDTEPYEGPLADLLETRLGWRPTERRYHKRVRLPARDGRGAALLAELEEPLRSFGADQLEGLRRHLSDLGLNDSVPLCLVGCGHSTTTQRALARVLPNEIRGLYLVTTASGVTAASSGVFGSDVPLRNGHWVADNSLLLKGLLCGAEGAVVGYRAEGPGGPVVRAEPATGLDSDRIETVQTAALQYCADLLAMFGPAVLTDGINPDAVLGWVSRIRPTFLLPPGELFAGLRIENDFGVHALGEGRDTGC